MVSGERGGEGREEITSDWISVGCRETFLIFGGLGEFG
jgi:hypothetical protein